MTEKHISQLASKGTENGGIVNIVLTAHDVMIEGFCNTACGALSAHNHSTQLWLGNPETQCPKRCSSPILTNLASLLAEAASRKPEDAYTPRRETDVRGELCFCFGKIFCCGGDDEDHASRGGHGGGGPPGGSGS
ncbi:protein PHOSPHATE-INDUCED 1 homolog [Arachis stenosperma]|uniref:protein PHOSPHATE-INDUCED 1 homolog n=1 Tax=Arachis stenosperma TaxID=217475 RepID=UPI0025AD8999|nr:protein PHOSPHATE-INDUCED 1 homolog [Arachis stenosperma]